MFPAIKHIMEQYNPHLILLLILRKELLHSHRSLLHLLGGLEEVLVDEHGQHNHHHKNGDPTPHCPRLRSHADVPHAALVDHLDGLVQEGGSVVVRVRLVEHGKGQLVLSRVHVVVDAEHVQEVHLVAGVQSAVEVTLSELRLT